MVAGVDVDGRLGHSTQVPQAIGMVAGIEVELGARAGHMSTR